MSIPTIDFSRVPKQTNHLNLISGGCNLKISACNGGKRASLAHAQKTFNGFIGENIKKCKSNTNKQSSTEETLVLVYEMRNQDVDFMTIYNSFGLDKEKLAFESQAQIEMFVIEHREWLQNREFGNFFLFSEELNEKQEWFVAIVKIDQVGNLSAFRNPLSDKKKWQGFYKHRFVIPAMGFLVS